MKDKVVMAIYPNWRGYGYAVFQGVTSPMDCGVVTIRPICNKRSLERIKDMIDYFQPGTLIIQGLSNKQSYKSNRVQRLLRRIEQVTRLKNVPVVKYSREQIRVVFEQFGAKTKFQIAHTIAKWLPQFKTKIPRYRKPWMAEDYHQGIFDAMSLILTYYYLEA